MIFEINLFFKMLLYYFLIKKISLFLSIPKSHKFNRKDFSVSLKKSFSDVWVRNTVLEANMLVQEGNL